MGFCLLLNEHLLLLSLLTNNNDRYCNDLRDVQMYLYYITNKILFGSTILIKKESNKYYNL